MTGADLIINTVTVWGLIGVAVAAVFLTVGMGRIDEDARGAVGFRPLLVPGIMVLWPLVLWRWYVLATGTDNWQRRHDPPRRGHAIVAAVLACVLALTLVLSVALRQSWPSDIAPERLSLPGEQPT
ncbi:MAG: hypothetical protein AAGA28_05165 [Pseudomonadota bacterium]